MSSESIHTKRYFIKVHTKTRFSFTNTSSLQVFIIIVFFFFFLLYPVNCCQWFLIRIIIFGARGEKKSSSVEFEAVGNCRSCLMGNMPPCVSVWRTNKRIGSCDARGMNRPLISRVAKIKNKKGPLRRPNNRSEQRRPQRCTATVLSYCVITQISSGSLNRTDARDRTAAIGRCGGRGVGTAHISIAGRSRETPHRQVNARTFCAVFDRCSETDGHPCRFRLGYGRGKAFSENAVSSVRRDTATVRPAVRRIRTPCYQAAASLSECDSVAIFGLARLPSSCRLPPVRAIVGHGVEKYTVRRPTPTSVYV